MLYSPLYDHVLSELEFGRTESGINLLVGMLDVADLQSSAISKACEELNCHPLQAMLQEDPLFADAATVADGPYARFNLLGQDVISDHISSTGQRLFAATREIAFARALKHRRTHCLRKLERAVLARQKVWLIIDPAFALPANIDTRNIRRTSEDEIRASMVTSNDMPGKFDLILAPHLPDQLSSRATRQLISGLAEQLSEHGEILMSAIRTGHPGTGWRRACFKWEPNCHSDEAIDNMAVPGLTSQSYRDQSGCIAWIEFRRS